ncbi:MAG: RsiW-degrading membrane proteinase PrsW (M82 family) [Oceanicoccus sp.]|jgi:RsiW-degrading membrane proteinase PrsW (M82 family)
MIIELFQDWTTQHFVRLAIVVALAMAPTIIWFSIMFGGRKTSRGPLFLAFFLGTLTVVPLLVLDYIFIKNPELDLFNAVESSVAGASYAVFVGIVLAAWSEEVFKGWVVRIINRTKIGIQTVNDAVRYSVLAGLGFAFTENIFYFYYIWQGDGFLGLLAPMIFRSIFTVCGHMVFSGIFGYYYGMSKFARPIVETKLWMGEVSKLIRWLSKILGVNEAKAFGEWQMLKGMMIAMMIHTAFNFMLELGRFEIVLVIVGGGFIYLQYLLTHKAGAIAFAGLGRESTMQKKDQDVVLELLAMWSKEGKHQDVIDICQRLLMRDPDNKVVQLFQAKAMDSAKLKKVEDSFGALFNAGDDKEKQATMRTLMKQKVLMEMLHDKQAPTTSTAPVTVVAPQAPSPETQQIGPSSQPSSPSVPRVPSPVIDNVDKGRE